MKINFNELMSAGYVVIPNFLTSEEIAEFVNDYNSRPMTTTNKNYQIKRASIDLLMSVKEKIKTVLESVKNETILDVDYLVPISVYTDTAKINFGYHQDHESYYFLQQNFNYLNFYIPIIKESSTLSGLDLIPFNNIDKVIPEYRHLVEGLGSSRYILDKEYTVKIDDNTGDRTQFPIDIDTIKESPQLSAGDLLLLRGDMIHKTQDTSTKRVAVSIRCTSSSKEISKEVFFQGCDQKKLMIKNNKKYFNPLEDKFKDQEIITAPSILDEYGGLKLI
jgi:hypothetical protein